MMAKFIFIIVRFPNQDVMNVKEGALHNYAGSVGVIQDVPAVTQSGQRVPKELFHDDKNILDVCHLIWQPLAAM